MLCTVLAVQEAVICVSNRLIRRVEGLPVGTHHTMCEKATMSRKVQEVWRRQIGRRARRSKQRWARAAHLSYLLRGASQRIAQRQVGVGDEQATVCDQVGVAALDRLNAGLAVVSARRDERVLRAKQSASLSGSSFPGSGWIAAGR